MADSLDRTDMATADDILNVMTVDVEDYFQVSAFDDVVSRNDWPRFESRVVANTERLLEIFDQSGVRATFFVLGWIAEASPDLVRRISSGGHEIASHGYSHRLVYDMTPEDFRGDLRKAKAVLDGAGATGVRGYRAPSYSITARSLWALDVLIEEGYQYDCSIFPIHHDRYGIPSSPRHPHVITRSAGSILEIPPSTVRMGGVNIPVSGGGYFRILPYTWTWRGIRRLNAVEHKPAVFYLHPWELDPGQPRLEAGWRSRFRHYTNLTRTEGRLRALLQDFRFGTISAALVEPAVAGQAGAAEAAAVGSDVSRISTRVA
jgi:polysaccharide deacetylase family protein (PEP-CTERM system associated)